MKTEDYEEGSFYITGSSYIWINVVFRIGQYSDVGGWISELLAMCHFVLVVHVYSSAG